MHASVGADAMARIVGVGCGGRDSSVQSQSGETLRGGLSSLSAQQLIVMGTFFVLPVYLQVVLGFDALETGKRLFPMSISMLAAALTGPKVAVRFGPRAVVQVGLAAMAIASPVHAACCRPCCSLTM